MKILIIARCVDQCFMEITKDGKSIYSREDYAPCFMPEGGSDYIVLEIDSKTGQLLNWDANKFELWMKDNL